MPDATTKKLLELLSSSDTPGLRIAAATVLSEIAGRDNAVAKALAAGLGDNDPDVRLAIIRAVGKLRVETALPHLLERVRAGGAEAEAAAEAVAKLGAKGTRGLRDLMNHTAPGLRRRIASALASGGTASAETAAVEALLDTDPGVVDASARSLIERIPTLSAEHRRSLTEQVIVLLKPTKGSIPSKSAEAALLRVLARLGDPRGESVFWARLDAGQPSELRAAALNALGTLPAPSAAERVQRLLACATDADFQVASPALMILKNVPVQEKLLKHWSTLLTAPDPAARRFGIERLGDRDQADIAELLIRQLQHPDEALRTEALGRLGQLKHGRQALTAALLESENPETAWTLARAQMPFVKEYPAALRAKLFKQACADLEVGERRADALLTLLREGDAKQLRDDLEERALDMRKKKNYAGALVYLRLLTRDPACGEAVRFEHAACALKISNRDLALDARTADPSLHQFSTLVHRHETPPIAMLEKAKWLTPEELFYVGFHFVEAKSPEKEFGGEVLRLLIKRAGRVKLAKDARSKLRSEGLE